MSAAIPLVEPGSLSGEKGPTEETLATEWRRIHGAEWRFDHGIGTWFHWDSIRWARDDTREAFDLIRKHLGAASANKQVNVGRASVARGVEVFASADRAMAVAHDLWDQDPFLLGTPAGVVDLRTGVLREARREMFITRSTSVAPCEGRPERWLQFIREVTNGDPELARFLQQVLGYCLTGSTREHALFFAYGAGKNGKSVFLNTASRILGDYATTAAMDTFTASRGDRHPTELARLDGARLVAASETEEGRAWAESRIKQLTGGDRIAARFMRADFFEFTPRFKLFIVGNFQPVLHSVDEATRRRFNIVPFIHTPAQPDLELEEKLAAEHPQILAWMIEGCQDWLKNGLCRPQAVVNATERYFEDQDLVGQWLAERCEVAAGKLGKPSALFDSWRQFATESGETVGTQKGLAGALQKRGFAPTRTSQGRFWRGVDLLASSRSTEWGHDA